MVGDEGCYILVDAMDPVVLSKPAKKAEVLRVWRAEGAVCAYMAGTQVPHWVPTCGYFIWQGARETRGPAPKPKEGYRLRQPPRTCSRVFPPTHFGGPGHARTACPRPILGLGLCLLPSPGRRGWDPKRKIQPAPDERGQNC